MKLIEDLQLAEPAPPPPPPEPPSIEDEREPGRPKRSHLRYLGTEMRQIGSLACVQRRAVAKRGYQIIEVCEVISLDNPKDKAFIVTLAKKRKRKAPNKQTNGKNGGDHVDVE
jgi:hypothetical protein